MEHRNGSRIPIRLNVSIWAGTRHLGWHSVINLSAGGFAVQGRVPGLVTHSLVTIEIETLEEGKSAISTLQAFVLYQNDLSVGFMWASDEAVVAKLKPVVGRAAA